MKKIIAHVILNICLALIPFSGMLAQGWERILSSFGQEELLDVVQHPDGGYLAVGSFNKQHRIYLVKTFADGAKQWSRELGSVMQTAGRSLVILPSGEILIAGFADGFGANGRDFILMKTDAGGNFLWQKNYGGPNVDEAFDMALTADGGLLLTGFTTTKPTPTTENKDIFLVKTDTDGLLQWEKSFGDSLLDEVARSLVLLPDGGAVLVGTQKTTGADLDNLVLRTDADGNLLWQQNYNLDITSQVADEGRAAVLASDGKLVMAGYTNALVGGTGYLMKINLDIPLVPDWFKNDYDPGTVFYGLTETKDGGFLACGHKDFPLNLNLFIVRTDSAGNQIWERDFGGGGPDECFSVIEAADGGAVAVGFKQPYLNSLTNYAYMVKTDPDGVIFTNQIEGNVFHDFDGNCLKDNGEPGLEDWIVKIEKPGVQERYAAANSSGFYRTQVDTGTYKITLYKPNPYWKACQPGGHTVSMTEYYDTVQVDIPVRAEFACPSVNVDVVTPVLVVCEENTYVVSYCNHGTIPAVNAKVEVTFDADLTVLSSTKPWSLPQSGQTYSFEIGFLNMGQCGSFEVTTFLDCATQVDETHCVTAHAFPDTFCKVAYPDWDGSIVRATGKCENNQVVFTLENIGSADMSKAVEYIVIEDVIFLVAPGDTTFQLDFSQSIAWQGEANGKTKRIIASQTPGYPGSGYVTAAVEGCLADTSGLDISLGYFTAFPDNENEPFLASDCQEAINQSPSSFKKGHPRGFGAEHFITDSTDLEYLIRFQNTGTDTVYSVEIRDTLSKWLDPTTVQAGAGSHPYDFEVYDDGIVLFRIPNTVLYPAGSVGDNESSGFVHFRVSQKPITPCDTLIVNRAAIFFNNQNPFTTNTVHHRVCNDTLFNISVKTTEIHWPNAGIEVFPNPFLEFADFKISGVTNRGGYRLELFDALGKQVFNNSYEFPEFRLHRYQLTPGVFFYRLSTNGGEPIASGKLIAD